jgi:hypothetical protein
MDPLASPRYLLPWRLVCEGVRVCRNPRHFVSRGALVDPGDENFGRGHHLLSDQRQSACASVVEGTEDLASLSVDKRRNVWRLGFRLGGYDFYSGHRHDGLTKDFTPGLDGGQAYSHGGK